MKGEKSGWNSKGQITIFIIIALLIVVGVVIYFIWLKPQYISSEGTSLNLESCMKKVIGDSIADLGEKAGYKNASLYYTYESKNIPYLCYTNLYYKPCINQEPFLADHFEEQLLEETRNKIYNCYETSVSDLKKKGYEITGDKKNLSISLDPGRVSVELEAPVTIARESTSKFTKFKENINSPIYDILMIATSIVQQETKYGDSDTASLMIFYPELGISKIKRDDGTTIYIIENRDTKTKFQFAVRSFAWPAGYGSDTGLVMQ